MGSHLRRLLVGIVAAVAVVVGAAVVTSPAGAAPITTAFSASSITIDCSSLQPGYYSSAHLTTSLSSLAPDTTYTIGTNVSQPWPPTQPFWPVTVTTDANGQATIDTTLSGQFVSGTSYELTAWQANAIQATGYVAANSCASGVQQVTGAPAASLDCPQRYLTPQGESSSAFDFTADMGGLVPGQPYVINVSLLAGSGSAYGQATARADGTIAFEQTSRNYGFLPVGDYSWTISTPSQPYPLARGMFSGISDPCPPIVKAPKRPALTHDSDVTGDGYADLVVIDITGRLLLYTNSINSNPGRVPFTTSRSIGSGWSPGGGMRSPTLGDISGDGVADLVAIRSDGALVVYYNNIGSSPAKLPFSSGTVIGSGWQSFTSIAVGDVDGDGYADLIGERSDGTRWFFKNRTATDPLHRPFSTGVQLPADGVATDSNGHGPALADLNGDGYADLTPGGYSLDLNRTPAGGTSPFPLAVPITQPSSMAPALDGWAVGDYEGRGSSGIIAADPARSGQLVYLKNPLDPSAQPTVIGDGWGPGLYTLVP